MVCRWPLKVAPRAGVPAHRAWLLRSGDRGDGEEVQGYEKQDSRLPRLESGDWGEITGG